MAYLQMHEFFWWCYVVLWRKRIIWSKSCYFGFTSFLITPTEQKQKSIGCWSVALQIIPITLVTIWQSCFRTCFQTVILQKSFNLVQIKRNNLANLKPYLRDLLVESINNSDYCIFSFDETLSHYSPALLIFILWKHQKT